MSPSRHGVARALLVAALAGAIPPAAAQRYETTNGCDEGRQREWESIIIAFEGDPTEQADARSVRDLNLRLCQDWKAGKRTSKDIEAEYDAAVDAWAKRADERSRARRAPAGGAAG